MEMGIYDLVLDYNKLCRLIEDIEEKYKINGAGGRVKLLNVYELEKSNHEKKEINFSAGRSFSLSISSKSYINSLLKGEMEEIEFYYIRKDDEEGNDDEKIVDVDIKLKRFGNFVCISIRPQEKTNEEIIKEIIKPYTRF